MTLILSTASSRAADLVEPDQGVLRRAVRAEELHTGQARPGGDIHHSAAAGGLEVGNHCSKRSKGGEHVQVEEVEQRACLYRIDTTDRALRPRSVDVGVDATCHVECRRENRFGRGGVSEVRAEHEDRACNEIIAEVIEALD